MTAPAERRAAVELDHVKAGRAELHELTTDERQAVRVIERARQLRPSYGGLLFDVEQVAQTIVDLERVKRLVGDSLARVQGADYLAGQLEDLARRFRNAQRDARVVLDASEATA